MKPDTIFCLPVALSVVGVTGLGQLLSRGPFTPYLSGAILYALTRSPLKFRQALRAQLELYVSSDRVNVAITALKGVFALGVARVLNRYLSLLAQNNMRLSSEQNSYRWPREIAVVTGAAGGFGSHITRKLAAKGVTVIAVDITEKLPDSLNLPKVFYYRCDITSRDAVMDLAARVKQERGTPSILINNAGILYTHSIIDASESAIKRQYDVNIISQYWTLQAFLPGMIKQRKGHVVAIASMAAFHGVSGLGAYSQTKAAVLSLHESLGQELRLYHDAPEVNFSVVHPTYGRTPMTNGFRKQIDKAGAWMIEPEDVAEAVVAQVFSGRGSQVILGGSGGLLGSILRGLPHWMSYAVLRMGESQLNMYDMGPERAGM